MPVRFIVTAVLLLVAGPLRGKKDRNLVFGSRPRTSASRFGFAVEKESARFRGVKFKAIREGGAVGNLPGMSGPSLSWPRVLLAAKTYANDPLKPAVRSEDTKVLKLSGSLD